MLAGLLIAACVSPSLAAASGTASGKKPVVTKVSPSSGSRLGGTAVTITGRNFMSGGKSIVKKVSFGSSAATKVRVVSAGRITLKAPSGKGTVDVTVTTTKGTSAKVKADRYTYLGVPAKYLVTSSSYGPLAGTPVTISAQLADKDNDPVAKSGVTVTWSKTGAAGSFSSTTSSTNAHGIATVTFTTGAVAGTVYTVKATDAKSRTGSSPAITTTGPPTTIAAKAGDGQTASTGAAVTTPPSVIVTDAGGNPCSDVPVTFAVASGGGSATGTSAATNANGIAAVGSWTLGSSAGANTLTATAPGLTGSPVTFTATAVTGLLQVQHNGVLVRTYSAADLQAVGAFAGYAGIRNSVGAVTGPEPVTGTRITSIVANALGTPMTAGQSVALIASDGYSQTFTNDQLVNFTGLALWKLIGADWTQVPRTSFTGLLAATLIYSNPDGHLLTADALPFRFMVVDDTSEQMVMTGSDSVRMVNKLNILN